MINFFGFLFKILGWSDGGTPDKSESKYIVVVAPHTSNLDFVFGILYAYQLGFKIRYFAKSQLFHWSTAWFFKFFGGIPVDRSKKNNLVSQAVEIIDSYENLIIGIAPEGTRKKTKKWKTGFYYMALEAKIPIALAYLDYKDKKAGIGKVIYPSGDIEKDFRIIEEFYSTIHPKHPSLYNKKII
ncbi:MAG: 1-acyl-sn-glycerol-3-phosphate acyltransferase [Flavobacteriales bacterium]|jgi:1-acyl-sn-glycerol-3-phosphate acyltransferase|tara:strand:+ start:4241 stop:4792 length:552 start_codon:yes stop_codon:yes gene_type:complete